MELNKKIAEWCGIEKWKPLPQFDRNLNACFKYIVPKLQVADISIEITCYRGGSDKAFGVITRDWSVCDIVHTESTYNYVSGDSLPLALCRAVEKLIDGEVS